MVVQPDDILIESLQNFVISSAVTMHCARAFASQQVRTRGMVPLCPPYQATAARRSYSWSRALSSSRSSECIKPVLSSIS